MRVLVCGACCQLCCMVRFRSKTHGMVWERSVMDMPGSALCYWLRVFFWGVFFFKYHTKCHNIECNDVASLNQHLGPAAQTWCTITHTPLYVCITITHTPLYVCITITHTPFSSCQFSASEYDALVYDSYLVWTLSGISLFFYHCIQSSAHNQGSCIDVSSVAGFFCCWAHPLRNPRSAGALDDLSLDLI